MGEGRGHVPTQKCFSIGHLVSMSGSSPGLGWVLTSLSTSELPVTTIKFFFLYTMDTVDTSNFYSSNKLYKGKKYFCPSGTLGAY